MPVPIGSRCYAISDYYDAAAVTPNDSTDLTGAPARGLYIGTAGTLRVTTERGTVANFGNVGVGELRLSVKRVHVTGTSATNIVALW